MCMSDTILSRAADHGTPSWKQHSLWVPSSLVGELALAVSNKWSWNILRSTSMILRLLFSLYILAAKV